MDTVLGLSMTSTAVGWVLVEGRDADGTILDHDEFTARTGGGVRAVKTSKRVTDAVLGADATATARDLRLHVIGVTWSDDAAAEAALLVESLTSAGFDNVVPVRLVDAAETLARGLVPVVGYDKTAVCVLEHDSATVVMVDSVGGEMQTAVKHVLGGADGLVRWLAKMFDRSGWQPEGVVVVGSDAELEGISWQLDDALPVPVFTQSGAELALARGAALASATGGSFGDAHVAESVNGHSSGRVRSRPMSYAGALTVLAAAAVTFVGSVSLAVGLRLAPGSETSPAQPLVRASASPYVAQAPVPSPAAIKQPPAPAQLPPAPVHKPPLVESPGSRFEQPSARPPVAVPAPPPPAPVATPPQGPDSAEAAAPEPDPHPLLTRVLEHIRGHHADPAPEPPAQAPNDGPPSP